MRPTHSLTQDTEAKLLVINESVQLRIQMSASWLYVVFQLYFTKLSHGARLIHMTYRNQF